MKYETRVVAFIDILGFKSSVNKSLKDVQEFDRILTSLSDLKEFFIKPKDYYDIEADREYGADTQILQVSDSLIISRLIEERGGIYYMISDCSFAIHLLISNGFLCRGAIKVGEMHHKDTTIFGPAFIDAYEAEKQIRLPYISFNEQLFEVVKHFPAPANQGSEQWEIEFIKKNCKEIENGEYYINYFTDYDDRVGGGEGTASMHYSKLRKIILEGLEVKCAYDKYSWAAEQFNLTATNFDLEPIYL